MYGNLEGLVFVTACDKLHKFDIFRNLSIMVCWGVKSFSGETFQVMNEQGIIWCLK